ncbi:Seven in absentia protein family [Popillia japonica]|uniref:Seven in absentia protein family n=1 Tax=Popillia japonica TaxID=7064 RepID=A0AAW1JEU5_POPJA
MASSLVVSQSKCSTCANYSYGHIYQCNMGHSVCAKCKEQQRKCLECNTDVTDVRNLGLEKLISLLNLPCPFYKNGCFEKYTQEHEEICTRRFYKCWFCPEKFVWEGPISAFKNHLKNYHKQYLLRGALVDLPNYQSESKRFILVNDDLFYFHQSLGYFQDVIHFNVRYIGDRTRNFIFKIIVSFDGNSSRSIKIKEPCGYELLEGKDRNGFVSVYRDMLDANNKPLIKMKIIEVNITSNSESIQPSPSGSYQSVPTGPLGHRFKLDPEGSSIIKRNFK